MGRYRELSLVINVCPAVQGSVSDKKVLPGNNSYSGTGPLSQFFQVVKEEVIVVLSLLAPDCLQLKIVYMPKGVFCSHNLACVFPCWLAQAGDSHTCAPFYSAACVSCCKNVTTRICR